MTRRDFGIKWTIYALALVLVLLINLYVLPWCPIFGTIPALLPVAAVTVAARYGVRQSLLGCLLCSAVALTAIDAVRVAGYRLMELGELPALLGVAIQEILWSLVFTPFIYLIFRWVHRRVP